MRFPNRLPVVLLLGLSACAYDAPVVPGIDFATQQPKPNLSVITGEIVLTQPIEAPGYVVVFVTDATNPMPPRGTGRPRTASTVPASAFVTDSNGITSAQFSVANIPDGTWAITAIMDTDGNFNPLSPSMGGATCGDLGGAYFTDSTASTLATVTVENGELADKTTVLLTFEYPLERPSLSVVDASGEEGSALDPQTLEEHGYGIATVNAEAGFADTLSQQYWLGSMGIHSELQEIIDPDPAAPATGEAPSPCSTYFPLYGVDVDGLPGLDPHPIYGEAGVADVWPKVYISYLGTPEVQDDGTIKFVNELEPGEVWAGENVPDVTYALFGQVRANQVTWKDTLRYHWLPGARHFYLDENGVLQQEIVQDVTRIPRGAYSVTMINHYGQTWTVPNDLPLYDATDASFDPMSQLVWLEVE